MLRPNDQVSLPQNKNMKNDQLSSNECLASIQLYDIFNKYPL